MVNMLVLNIGLHIRMMKTENNFLNSRHCIKCGKIHDTIIEDTTTKERLEELEKCHSCILNECSFDWWTDQIELYGIDENMDVKDMAKNMKLLEKKVIDAMDS